MGGSSKKQTVGYQYYVGMHMVLCHGPVDRLEKIEVAERVAYQGSTTGSQTLTIDKPELFGGEQREGGLTGELDFLNGEDDQAPNEYLSSQLGTDIPAFRGVVSVVLKQFCVGQNPYLKLWAFWAKRTTTRTDGTLQWNVEKATIGRDMNPAHIVRECLTDRNWGLSYSDLEIDDVSFSAAAETLFSEEMGMSLLWDRSMEVEEFILEVLRHINATLYVSRDTGLFTFKLIREVEDASLLPLVDESAISRVTNFKRGSIGELVNSVTANFWNMDTGSEDSLTVQDIALIAQQGGVVGAKREYPGFTNQKNALRVASQDLKALSTPLARATIYTNRTAGDVHPGDAFRLSWADFGVSEILVRATSVEIGGLEDGEVKIEVVEDVFSSSQSLDITAQESLWTEPDSDPVEVSGFKIQEASWWELAQALGDSAAQDLDPLSCFFVVAAISPTPDAFNAEIWSETSGYPEEVGLVDFCPNALLSSDIDRFATTLHFSGADDIESVRLGSYLTVNSEEMMVSGISSNTVTVVRGVNDTLPAAHAAESIIYFADDYFASSREEYLVGETAQVKLLATTSRGRLAYESAPFISTNLNQRAQRPYPPGNFRVNGVYLPEVVLGSGINVSWSHRDRLLQTGALVGCVETGNIGPEPGVTYTCNISYQSGEVVENQSGLSGTSVFVENTSVTNGLIEVHLRSDNGALQSTNSYTYLVTMAGYGNSYGKSYGGVNV